MLNLSNLRVPFAGAAIAAAAFGTAATLEAHTVEKEGAASLNVSSGVEQFRGRLSGKLAPEYDGPVLWGSRMTRGEDAAFGIVIGALGGFGIGVMTAVKTDRLRWIPTGVLAGATIIGGLAYLASDLQEIEFNTKISSVLVSNQPHTEMVRSGKTQSEQGPFFGQILSIPETDLMLAANAKGAPMLPGQNIRARFWVNSDNQIVSWTAAPGPRGQ